MATKEMTSIRYSVVLSVVMLLILAMANMASAVVPVTYSCCVNLSFSDGTMFDDFENLTLGGTVIDDFENIGNWTISGGTASSDTVNFKTGSKGMNLTTTTAGARVTADKTNFNSNFSTTSNFGLWVFVKNVSTYSKIDLYFGSHGSTFNTYFICSQSNGLSNGWNAVIILKSSCTTANGESWNNIMNITRIAITPQSGLNTSVTVDSYANDTNYVWSIASVNGNVSVDSNNTKTGVGALQISGVSANNYSVFMDKVINNNFSAINNIAFWMFVPSAPQVPNNSVTLSITSTGVAWSKNFHAASYGVQSGWNRIIFNKNQFANSGGEDWNNIMNRLRFTLNQNATLDDLSINASGQRAKLIFSYDDGDFNVSALGLPIMAANDQAGVVYIVTNQVGNVGKMNLSQLRSLQTSGWDVSSHAADHTSLTTLDDTNLSIQLNSSFSYLVNNLFRKSSVYISYPSSNFNDNVVNHTRIAGYIIARDGGSGLVDNMSLNPYSIVKLIEPMNTTTIQSIEDNINDTIKSNLIGVLELHDVDTDCGNNAFCINTTLLQNISNYLAGRSADIDVVTFSDLAISNLPPYTPIMNKSVTIFSNGSQRITTNKMSDEYYPNMTIIPSSSNVSVNVTTWRTSSEYLKVWIESSDTHNITTNHAIGDFPSNSQIDVLINGFKQSTLISNSSGHVNFVYSGGFSTVVFELKLSQLQMDCSSWSTPSKSAFGSISIIILIVGIVALLVIIGLIMHEVDDNPVLLPFIIIIGLLGIYLVTILLSSTSPSITDISVSSGC